MPIESLDRNIQNTHPVPSPSGVDRVLDVQRPSGDGRDSRKMATRVNLQW
jgi:hypothetical protein